MSDPLPDDDLQSLFQNQREADHARAPGFHAMRTRALASTKPAPHTSFAWPWALAGSMAILLAFVTVTFLHSSTKPQLATRETVVRELDQIDAALQKNLTAWQSPTDFLLNPINHEPIP